MCVRHRVVGAAAAVALSSHDRRAGAFFGGKREEPRAAPHCGPVTEASALISARGICRAAHIGFVITNAPEGAPDCRIMDLHGPWDDSLRVALVTRAHTRKAAQLRADARCTVAFHDPRSSGESGYLSLAGRVREVVEPQERRARWKESWTLFHTAPEVAGSDVVVYEFTPERMELVDNDRWLRGENWAPVTLVREKDRWVPAVRRRPPSEEA